jgi:hypothetical protein
VLPGNVMSSHKLWWKLIMTTPAIREASFSSARGVSY